MKEISIILAALVLIIVGTNAQDQVTQTDPAVVIVELKNGSIIEGKVNSWEIGKYIDLKTEWNESMVLPSEAILKVQHKSALEFQKYHNYNFRENGVYYTGKFQLIVANNGERANKVNGLGLSFSSGYRFSRLVGVGAGIGYDRFIWNTAENFVPIFAEFSSFFIPKNTSLFANVQAGYSIAIKDEDFSLTEARGGLMFYPAIGLRLGGLENKFTVDVGYKFQRAKLTYSSPWTRSISEQRLTYKRLTVRIGILM